MTEKRYTVVTKRCIDTAILYHQGENREGWESRESREGSQEAAFHTAKGRLSHCKRPSFTRWKTAFCKRLTARGLRIGWFLAGNRVVFNIPNGPNRRISRMRQGGEAIMNIREFSITGMSHLSVFCKSVSSRHSAEKRNPVEKTKAAYPYAHFLDSAFQRNDDLTLSGRKAKKVRNSIIGKMIPYAELTLNILTKRP